MNYSKTMPERLKRDGRFGKVPEGAKLVDRSTRWGNPFTVEEYGRDECLKLYRQHIAKCIEDDPEKYNLNELKGKNLVCHCKLDEHCHADILLELAND